MAEAAHVRLEGATAWVTGVGAGIGRAIAGTFAGAGAAGAVTDLDAAAAAGGSGRRPGTSQLAATLALLSAAPVTTAFADTVYMRNGDRITGEVNRIWDNELYLETDYADEFTVSLEEVARIESTEAFEIELRDHSVVSGRLVAGPQGGMVLVTEEGTRPLQPMAIEEMITAEEDYFDWEARSDFSYTASSGNTDTVDFLWQAEGELKLGDHRDRLEFSLQRKEQDGLTTKEQHALSYTHSWFFADKWFMAGGLGYERDPIRDLTYRYTPGLGLGYQFFEDAYRLLEISLSGVAVRERLAGESSDSFAPRWQLRYRRDMLDGDMEFFHDHALWVYLVGRDNTVLDTSTGIRWDVWGDIYLNAQFDWNWESDPAAGRKKEDITYLLGIGVELD